MLVSIVITNYNYAQYLAAAIDSALEQTHPEVEVIVVDDGSSDNSRDIIQAYGQQITAILQENSGQCCAVNTGFRHCHGAAVIFLDADDVLLENAAALHARGLERSQAVKSCGYMEVIDSQGRTTGAAIPARLAPSGDYREASLKTGMRGYKSSFTSGNAWSRLFLNEVMPLPEDETIGPDGYLTAVDALFGRIESIPQTVVRYRVHGSNKGPINFRFEAAYMRDRLQRWRHRIGYAESWIARLGYQIDGRQFRKLRDWKLVLMSYSLGLMNEPEGDVATARELVSSPFSNPVCTLGSRLAIACMLALVAILPRQSALQVSQYLLLRSHLKRTRLSG